MSQTKKATVPVTLIVVVLIVYLWSTYQRPPVMPTTNFSHPRTLAGAGQMTAEEFTARHGVRPEEITFWLGAKSNGRPKVVRGNGSEIADGIQKKLEASEAVIGRVGNQLLVLSPHCGTNPGGWAAIFFPRIPEDGLVPDCDDVDPKLGDRLMHVGDDWVQLLIKDHVNVFEFIERMMDLFGLSVIG